MSYIQHLFYFISSNRSQGCLAETQTPVLLMILFSDPAGISSQLMSL